jgi:hypothetical protein
MKSKDRIVDEEDAANGRTVLSGRRRCLMIALADATH